MTHELDFAEPDTAWPHRFETLRVTYLLGLPRDACVEHVGSTAVPGLVAKDCIDILVTVPAEQLDRVLALLTASGFEHRPASFATDAQRQMLRLLGPRRNRVAHLHLMATAHRAAAEMIAVRDLLHQDRAWRERYERVKRELAEQFPTDRASYIAGKDAIMRELTQAAAARSSQDPRS